MKNIEWATKTWNPIIGCSKVSEGCDNCYAEKMACRLAGMQNKQIGTDYSSVTSVNRDMKPKYWGGNSLYRYDQVTKPARWKKPQTIFVCSMGDLFHKSVKFEFISAVYDVMCDYSHHTYIILTKRPERMLQFYEWKKEYYGVKWQAKNNIWLGVSAENQNQANKRIPILMDIPALIKFVSIEPMLGDIDLTKIKEGVGLTFDYLNGYGFSLGEKYIDGPKLNWVICGGETGHNARPMHPNWVRLIRDQCKKANVPFFFKGWGEWQPTHFGGMGNTSGKNNFNWCERGEKWQWMCKFGKQNSGLLLDDEKHYEFPKIEEVVL